MTPRPLCAGAGEFIDGQYPDRPDLRPILDATLALAPTLGEVAVQTLGPRRWPRVSSPLQSFLLRPYLLDAIPVDPVDEGAWPARSLRDPVDVVADVLDLLI